jgi:uncharacterized protein (TIGR02246 family)
MSRCRGLTCAIILSVIAQGCASMSKSGFPQRDETAQRSITSNWQARVNAHDWNGVAATYTADAILMPPNGPNIQGRDNIRQFFTNFPPISDMKLELMEIDGRDDIAFVRGIYSMNISLPTGSTVHDTGKYVELRKKQADGTWLIARDMFSSDQPAQH